MIIHEMAGMFITLECEDYKPQSIIFPANISPVQCSNNSTKSLEIGLGFRSFIRNLLILLLGLLCKSKIQSRLLNGKAHSSAPVFEAVSLQPTSSISRPTHHDEED